MNTHCAAPKGAVSNGCRFFRFAGRGFHLPSRPSLITETLRFAGRLGDGWESALSTVNPPWALRRGLASALFAAWRDGVEARLRLEAELALARNAVWRRDDVRLISYRIAHDVARRCAHANSDAIQAILVPMLEAAGLRGQNGSNWPVITAVRAAIRDVRQPSAPRSRAPALAGPQGSPK